MAAEYPSDLGLTAYGASAEQPGTLRPQVPGGAAGRAVRALARAARSGPFWLLAGGFAICGATTNGLVGTHFIPAAHDHGMAETAAAGLLALVGLFDIIGTIASGWLTDRMDSRLLLGAYYALRGASLLVLPCLFAATVRPSMVVFILFYGLDWVATVPPTVALCREYFGADGPVVFGWVFASHQVGAAIAATAAGVVRDQLGNYALAWYVRRRVVDRGGGAVAVPAALPPASARAAGAAASRRNGDGHPRHTRLKRRYHRNYTISATRTASLDVLTITGRQWSGGSRCAGCPRSQERCWLW